MRQLLLTTAIVLAAIGGAAAQDDDEYPYRADGPKRDLFIQQSISGCVVAPIWKNMGSEKEVKAFCECKALFMADNWSQEDEDEWIRSYSAKEKAPASINAKWKQSQLACVQNFKKLPKVPARAK